MSWPTFEQWGPWAIMALMFAMLTLYDKVKRLEKVHDRVVSTLWTMPSYIDAAAESDDPDD